MKNFFEAVGLLVPTLFMIFTLIIIIDIYFLIRKYLKLKIDYYTNKINGKNNS